MHCHNDLLKNRILLGLHAPKVKMELSVSSMCHHCLFVDHHSVSYEPLEMLWYIILNISCVCYRCDNK